MLPQAAQDMFRIELEEGRFFSDLDVESEAKVCVVERASFSDEIFGPQIPLGAYIKVGKDRFKIIGTTKRLIFRFGYPERMIVLFPSTSLQRALGIRKYSAVELRVKNIEEVPLAHFQLKQALSQRFGFPSDIFVSEYSRYVQTALEIVNLLTILIMGIAVISLSVGGVGIMNVMMTMVVEQTREIGISKALGARNGSVLLLFLTQSTVLTVVGGVAGIIFGLGASKLVSMLVGIPFIVPAWVIILGLALSLGVGIISGSYPAKRASKLDPVEALRQL
jgi:putative ABC transport system permease protein